MRRFANLTGARLLLMIVLSALIIFPFGCSKKENESEEITIGAILPLTGSAAIWGQNVKNGINLAVRKVNAGGGIDGKRIIVIYEDSRGLPNDAVMALNKIIATHNVPAILGEVASSCVLSMAPIAERRKVVLLSPGASNPEITYAGEYIFRNWHSDNLEGAYLAKVAYENLNMRRIGIVYVNNGYGRGLEKVFSRKFVYLGGNIATSEGFDQDATDFRSQLTRVKATDCDGIFLPGYPKEIPEVLKQAKELGINKQFL